MSRSVSTDYETLRERECESDRRNRMALYAMKNDWVDGKFDYPKIRGILEGRDTTKCAEHCGTSAKLEA